MSNAFQWEVLTVAYSYQGLIEPSGKRACNCQYRNVDGEMLSVTINRYPYTVEPRLSEPLWSPKFLRCSDSQNRMDNENQNGVHDRKSTGERDRQLIVLSSTHRQSSLFFYLD